MDPQPEPDTEVGAEGFGSTRRQPRNVLVYLFRRVEGSAWFLLLRRSDDGVWQAVCGGVEGDESLDDAAQRELREEVGLTELVRLRRLEIVGDAPRSAFEADSYWPAQIRVVEKHFYGVELDEGLDIELSPEHTALEWLASEEAYERLTYADERLALLELHSRIQSGLQYYLVARTVDGRMLLGSIVRFGQTWQG